MHYYQLLAFILAALLIVLAGMHKATMDVLWQRYDDSIFADTSKYDPQYYDPFLSANNKWLNGDKSQGEAFLFSSTIAVALTDAWHKAQFHYNSCRIVSLMLIVSATYTNHILIMLSLMFVGDTLVKFVSELHRRQLIIK